MYRDVYDWSKDIGDKLIKAGGDDLVRRVVFDIRGEQLPGKFLDKLMTRLAEYKTDTDLNLTDLEINPEVFRGILWGNSFHYLKSAIMAGLVNSMAKSAEAEAKKDVKQ
jgi:hypothetical protein